MELAVADSGDLHRPGTYRSAHFVSLVAAAVSSQMLVVLPVPVPMSSAFYDDGETIAGVVGGCVPGPT